MDKPRRRAAGRPEGPPDQAPTSAQLSNHPAQPSTEPDRGPAPDATSGPGGQAAPDGSAPPQHRRRQRPPREAAGGDDRNRRRPDAPAPQPAATPEPAPARAARPALREERRRGESAVERSLRALVSTRTTTLTPTVAMRAREVAAPTAADLAEARDELVIVRRHYIPPAPLVAGKKDPGGTERIAKAPEQRARADGRRGGRRPQRGAGE